MGRTNRPEADAIPPLSGAHHNISTVACSSARWVRRRIDCCDPPSTAAAIASAVIDFGQSVSAEPTQSKQTRRSLSVSRELPSESGKARIFCGSQTLAPSSLSTIETVSRRSPKDAKVDNVEKSTTGALGGDALWSLCESALLLSPLLWSALLSSAKLVTALLLTSRSPRPKALKTGTQGFTELTQADPNAGKTNVSDSEQRAQIWSWATAKYHKMYGVYLLLLGRSTPRAPPHIQHTGRLHIGIHKVAITACQAIAVECMTVSKSGSSARAKRFRPRHPPALSSP